MSPPSHHGSAFAGAERVPGNTVFEDTEALIEILGPAQASYGGTGFAS